MKIFRIHFEDHGQDFLTWDVNIETGKVVDCAPFQSSIWCGGTVDNVDNLETGGQVEYTVKYGHESLLINYPIEDIEALEVEEVKDGE